MSGQLYPCEVLRIINTKIQTKQAVMFRSKVVAFPPGAGESFVRLTAVQLVDLGGGGALVKKIEIKTPAVEQDLLKCGARGTRSAHPALHLPLFTSKNSAKQFSPRIPVIYTPFPPSAHCSVCLLLLINACWEEQRTFQNHS